MDKKQSDKILDMLRSLQAGGIPQDANLPEHIKELIRNAEDTGAKVVAVTSEQFEAMGGDVADLLGSGMMLSVSAARDLKDPRYAFGNQCAKELADREIELMQILKGKAVIAKDAIHLQALMFANIDDIMDFAKEKSKESADGEVEVLTTLAMMKTLGISNIYDALQAGPHRLRWHGVPSRAINFIMQMGDNIPQAIASRLDLPLSAVRLVTDALGAEKPLAPLPPEKVFDPDLNGKFMRNLLPDANAALDVLVAKGFNSLNDVFAKTQGLTELEEKFGIDPMDVAAFAMILEQLDGVSVEALDAVVAMLPEDENEEAERLAEAERQPVIPLTDPVVIAALGTNLITTLEIAGVADLHEVSGLRKTEAGEMIRKALSGQQIRAVKDILRFKNELCPCEACAKFKQAYVEMHPAVKLALRIPAQKPTLH